MKKNQRAELAVSLLMCHPMILVISVTLHSIVGKLSKRKSINQKIHDLVNDAIQMFKEDLKTLKTYLY